MVKIFTGLFMIIVFQVSLYATVPQIQREALVALYNSTNGDNWDDNTNWNSGDPCGNDWYGVVCDDENITSLDLSVNQLAGSIPAEIGNLRILIGLDLAVNQLTGSIPVEIENLTGLTWLYLNENCNLYSDDTDVQVFIDNVEHGDSYQDILDTNTHNCNKSAIIPAITYLLF